MAELRAHGTSVTPEAFASWKARFDAELVRAGAARPPAQCSTAVAAARWHSFGVALLACSPQLEMLRLPCRPRHVFLACQALEKAKLEEAAGKSEDKKGRLTGKAWFLQQEAAHIEVRGGPCTCVRESRSSASGRSAPPLNLQSRADSLHIAAQAGAHPAYTLSAPHPPPMPGGGARARGWRRGRRGRPRRLGLWPGGRER